MKKKNYFMQFFLIMITIFIFLSILKKCIPVYGAEQSTVTSGETSISYVNLSSFFPEWCRQGIFGIAIWQFLGMFIFILFGLILKKISDIIFEKKLIPLFKKTRFDFDNLFTEALSKPFGYFILLIFFAGAFGILPLPKEPNVRGFIFGVLKILTVGNFLWLLFRVIDIFVGYLAKFTERTESKLDDQFIPLIRKSLKITIGIVCFLWVFQLLGYNVSSLLAGLGIGGLAVALALQDPLMNFFGSIFIFLDRPFVIGDWIKVGDIEGIVEDIGFRSTRIRTWPATLVAIPNKTVANATIDNWSKMPKRRVSQTVGVTYKTSVEQMERVLSAIQELLKKDKDVDKEFMVVRFTDFGESSLNILVYYFTKSTSFGDYLETKERINLSIMRILKNMGLSIAFPTHTVYLEKEGTENFDKEPSQIIEENK